MEKYAFDLKIPYNPTKEDIKNRITFACDNGVFVYKGEIYDGKGTSFDYIPDLTYWADKFVPFEDEYETCVWAQTKLFDAVVDVYAPLGEDAIHKKYLKVLKKFLLRHLDADLC